MYVIFFCMTLFFPGWVLAQPSAEMAEVSSQGNGQLAFHGVMEVESVDEDAEVLTLKVYINKKEGEYTFVSCAINEQTQVEKDGANMDPFELMEGDKVFLEETVTNDTLRPCGTLRVITSEDETK